MNTIFGDPLANCLQAWLDIYIYMYVCMYVCVYVCTYVFFDPLMQCAFSGGPNCTILCTHFVQETIHLQPADAYATVINYTIPTN